MKKLTPHELTERIDEETRAIYQCDIVLKDIKTLNTYLGDLLGSTYYSRVVRKERLTLVRKRKADRTKLHKAICDCPHPTWISDGHDSHHDYEKCAVCGLVRTC